MADPLIYVPFADFAVSYDGPMLPLGTSCAIAMWEKDRVRPTSVLRRGGILVGTSADHKVAHLCFKLEDGYAVEEVDINFVGVDCTISTVRDAIAEWAENTIDMPDEAYNGYGDWRTWIDAVMNCEWADAVAVSWTQFARTFYVRDLDDYALSMFILGVHAIVRHRDDSCKKSK